MRIVSSQNPLWNENKCLRKKNTCRFQKCSEIPRWPVISWAATETQLPQNPWTFHVILQKLSLEVNPSALGWLHLESGYGANKQGSRCGRQLWARLLELLELVGASADKVAAWWEEVAGREGGIYWKSLVLKWCQQQLLVQGKETLLERHKDVAARRRSEEAEERTRSELDARRMGGVLIQPYFTLSASL